MVESFYLKTSFTITGGLHQELEDKRTGEFNFGYDVVDAWAAEQPDKPALLWTNDQGECRQFTFADMKRYTDMTASYFQSLGIGHGDMVMLILKRRYEFWFSIIALHKLGAVVIPRHTPAHQERYCIPLQCRRHQDDLSVPAKASLPTTSRLPCPTLRV